MNGLTSLPLINKVEFGYSFSGQMTPDQLNNKYFAKCISCIEHLVTSCTYDGQVVKSQSLVEVNQALNQHFEGSDYSLNASLMLYESS